MNESALPELPGGWVWTRLEDACIELMGGGTPSREISEYFGGNIIWLTPTEVPKNKIAILKDSKEKITESGLRNSSAKIIPKDSVLLTSRASIGFVAIAGCDVTTNQGFASFVCSNATYNFYLAYWLWANKDKLESNATGTTFKEISKSKLREFYIPLPPLPEQRRIVTKIEELFTKLDAGVSALKKTQAQLKHYRRSVLKAACEGKLVPTEAELAKAEGRDYEAADVLLARINDIRKRNKKGKYIEMPTLDISDLPKLPEGWLWVQAQDVCNWITNGYTPKANKMFQGNGEIPFIKVYNLTNKGELDFSKNPTFISKETHTKELFRSNVFPGDILMNIVGPPLGKVSIVPDIFPEWNINQAIVIYRPLDGFERKFLCYSLLTDNILSWAIKRSKATAGQFNLTITICRNLPLPLPPLAEQRRIVAEVERRLSIADGVEKTVGQSLAQAERLRQSILKKAFEGRLVAQDASDEPAGVLLERIRLQKQIKQPKKGSS